MMMNDSHDTTEVPDELKGERYTVTAIDPETGETLVGSARCARPPSPELQAAFQVLMQMAVAAYRDGTLPDEAYD